MSIKSSKHFKFNSLCILMLNGIDLIVSFFLIYTAYSVTITTVTDLAIVLFLCSFIYYHWRWFDAECRAAKRTTRSLERAYRHQPSAETLSACRFCRCWRWTISSRSSSHRHTQLGIYSMSSSSSSSLADNVVSFSGRRPNTGQLRLRVVRVTHGSYGTRLTKSSSRRLHPSSHSVLVTWRCTSLVRSTRSALTLRQRPHYVS